MFLVQNKLSLKVSEARLRAALTENVGLSYLSGRKAHS